MNPNPNRPDTDDDDLKFTQKSAMPIMPSVLSPHERARVTIRSGMRSDGIYLLPEALRELAAKDGWQVVELANDEVMISKEIEITPANPMAQPFSVEILR